MAELSPIDRYVIERVRERRNEIGMTGADLSYRLGKADSYISVIESLGNDKHYNIAILNEIAKVLNCSPRLFWPEDPL